jgi:sugar phosphate permease
MLLSVKGFGLDGWQWLYLIESVPSILLGLFVLFWLTDRPEQAKWLPPEQRAWLARRLEVDQNVVETKRFSTLTQVFTSPVMFCLALVYLTDVAMTTRPSRRHV